MLLIREIPLPAEARRLLEGFAAAGPEPAGGFWQRLKSSATLDRKFLAARAAAAKAALARGVCDEVHVRHDSPPCVSEHEHGIFVFVAAGDNETLLLDVSSVSDDPRWRLHDDGALMRAEWRWLRFAGLEGSWSFAADGPPVTPRKLAYFHGTALERRLTEDMEWPGDDAVLALPIAEIAKLASE